MTEVVGVRFERAGKIYYFASGDLQLAFGDHVIVDSSKGLDFGTVTTPVQNIDESGLGQPLRPVVRVATEEDEAGLAAVKQLEPAALEYCQQQIEKLGLPMKLLRVNYTFDGSKIVFYFSSENRVDFRELVKVLAGHFHARIELRQVGVRDEARIVGGYSTCGRELCCASFLENFHPVSIKMAKKQNLALNPAKISGVCGRLMCCLYYEYDEDGGKGERPCDKGECDGCRNGEADNAELAEELAALNDDIDEAVLYGEENSKPAAGLAAGNANAGASRGNNNNNNNKRERRPRGKVGRSGPAGKPERTEKPENAERTERAENGAGGENKGKRPAGKGPRRGRRPGPKKAPCDNNCRECKQEHCSRRRPAADKAVVNEGE